VTRDSASRYASEGSEKHIFRTLKSGRPSQSPKNPVRPTHGIVEEKTGIVISRTAECRHQQVKALVCPSVSLLQNGQRLADIDSTGLLRSSPIVPNDDGMSVTVTEEGIKEALYADCSVEDRALAKRLLVAEPAAPLETPLILTKNFASMPPDVFPSHVIKSELVLFQNRLC
jgi:hypothetical protein